MTFCIYFLRSADEHDWIKVTFEHRDYQSNSVECIFKNRSEVGNTCVFGDHHPLAKIGGIEGISDN